jgi:hypothetical protein
MAVQQFGNYGAFANSNARGGGFFNWKEKGFAEVWLHMAAAPIVSHRHNVPTLVTWEDKETRKKEIRVWSRKYVCWETAGVLAEQHFYEDKAKGIRSTPPTRCLLCRLNEWARKECLAFERTRKKEVHKGLDLTSRVFDFKGDRDNERKVIRLGGMCNLFGWKDLGLAAKKAIKAAKNPAIYKNGWDQNFMAKQEFGFFIVPDNDPDHGVRFTPEASGLGQQFQKAIKELLEAGTDPSTTPIGMRWKYNKEASFNEMYGVTILREPDGRLKKPSTRIRQLLEGDVPSVPKDFVEPYNQTSMLMMLKEHCKGDVAVDVIPWAKLIPSKEQMRAWLEEGAPKPVGAPPAKSKKPKDEPEEEETFACDNEKCGKPVKATDEECPHCGLKFDVDADAAPRPESPKKKKKKTSAASTNGGGSKKSPAHESSTTAAGADFGDYPGGEDDIPFIRDATRGRWDRP